MNRKQSADIHLMPTVPDPLEPWQIAMTEGGYLRGYRTLPRGKPVIHFIHGNGFCGLSYWPFLQHLIKAFDVVTVDVPGQGDSDLEGPYPGWNEMAERVALGWQHMREDYRSVPAMGMGHSMGGAFTALMAANNPTFFSKLVLLDPVLFAPIMLTFLRLVKALGFKSPNPLVRKALRRQTRWPTRADAKRELDGAGVFKGWDESALDAYVNFALRQADDGVSLKCSPQREAEVFASYPYPLWSELMKIQQSMTILYGEDTAPFMKRAIKVLASKKAVAKKTASKNTPLKETSCQVKVMAGGHCFMQEYPEAAAKAVLRSISPSFFSR